MDGRHDSISPSAGRQWAGAVVGMVAMALLGVAAVGGGYTAAHGIGKFLNWLATKPDGQQPAPEGPKERPLFADWPSENPAAVLLVTGEWLGHMRPCGCSENQQGGLAHLGDLKRYMTEEKKWNVVPIDLGDLVGPDPNAETAEAETPLIDRRSNAKIDLVKYRYVVQALKTLGYTTSGIGLGDLRIGINEIVGEAINLQNLKLVAANLGYVDADFASVLNEIVKPINIVTAGELRIGICSWVPAGHAQRLPDAKVKLGADDATLQLCKAALDKASVGLRVLLVHAAPEEAVQLATKAGNFDLVVCNSPLDDPTRGDIKRVGKTTVVWSGRKGKWALAVGYWKSEPENLRVEIVPLDNRLGEMPAMNDLYARFVRAVKDEDLLSKTPRLQHSSKSGYVGAVACGKCHTKAYEKWKDTKHAHAMESLVKNQKPAGQEFNPECVSCHSTGFRFTGGFVSLAKTPQFAGNQCENCHGPGERHANDGMEGKNPEFIRPLKLSRVTVAKTCYECHDKDNSPKFEFNEYFQKIVHPWKD